MFKYRPFWQLIELISKEYGEKKAMIVVMALCFIIAGALLALIYCFN